MTTYTYKRTCKRCGKEFISHSQRTKYCSPQCKVEAAKEKRKEWEAHNPEYMKNYMANYRREKKAFPCTHQNDGYR